MAGTHGSAISRQLSIRTLGEIGATLRQLISELKPLGYADKEIFAIRLSLEEALVNAIKHGNCNDPTKLVRILYEVCPQKFQAEIEDQGRGFDPDNLPSPLAPENVERPGGRGVFLMRHYMSWVQFSEVGNAVTLCKMRHAAA